ncbi:centrosomal protein of 164 kDa [Heteronotia binoei]|uniref:centrosomal protein of 164 kDa n=1 Tax=Heteronotia binoei TaxID=13085 RepID=UPI00292FEDBB|nr:centrosomal protein of 164 kDa [Heteronotia binoei]
MAGPAAAAAAIRIGDQLILEEDYDETYIPSEQEILEFARMIGIEPAHEPELMWLAREGIVAPLPAEWKPCQDITGDIYYFNFANGQSTWDHPCDEHYRQLVVQEREKLLGQGGGVKKKEYKKKKKEKKDKKEKRERDQLKRAVSPGSVLTPVHPPLGGSLAPLRGSTDAPFGVVCDLLNSSGRSSGGPRAQGPATTVLSQALKSASLRNGSSEEAAASLMQLTLDGTEKEEDGSECPRGEAGLLKNLHVDVSALGTTLDNEEVSKGSSPVNEWQVSDHLDPEPNDVEIPDFENVLDKGVCPEALGSTEFGVSRAAAESTWKEKADGSLAQEKDQSGEEQSLASRGEAEADKRERSGNCSSAKERVDEQRSSVEKMGLADAGALEEEEGRTVNGLKDTKEPDAPCQGAFGAAVRQTEPSKQHSGDSLEEISKEEQNSLEPLKMHPWQEEEEEEAQVQRFRQEEAMQLLRQQKEAALWSLKTELEKTRQEEELRLREVLQDRLLKLQIESQSELEAEKERLRLEQEAAMHKLQEDLESLQQSEKARLQEQKQLVLERMKMEAEAIQQAELKKLEQENMRALGEMKERLQREKEMAVEELEEQFAAELQHQQNVARAEHLKVVSGLQSQVAEDPRRQEAELREDASAEQKAQQKSHQVAEYKQELGCLLEEQRQEMEQDHSRRVERMRKAHQEALARIQQQYEDEERKQRAERVAAWRSEQHRLEELHEAELQALWKKQAMQLKDLQKSHQQQEEILRKKKQEALDEGKKVEQEIREATLAAQLRIAESQGEQEALSELIQQLRKAVLELQAQKAELESQVELLHLRSQCLQKQISELEAASRSKQELLEKLEGQSNESSPRKTDEALRVEDLGESGPAPSSREMGSETNQSHEESSLVPDQVRHYIAAEGASIKNTREFLVHQTRSMRKRQSTLRSVKQHWSHDLQRAQEAVPDPDQSQVLEGVYRSLEEESRQLDAMSSAMRRGQALVKKKEETLSQLEASLLEELSEEDTLKGTACKKIVTFDLSDLEDSGGRANPEEFPHTIVGLKPDLPFPQSDKIQYLTESLQRITSDLTGVLAFLGTFSHQQPPRFTSTQGAVAPLPKEGMPLAAYLSLARTHPASPLVCSADQGPWSSGLGFRGLAASSGSQAVDSMLAEKWRKYFPGGFPLPFRSSGSLDGKLGCAAAREQVCLFQQCRFQAHETEMPNIQGMIEANKKWLESFKHDSKIPLLPSSPKKAARPAGPPMHLGLDDSNQIQVFHF